ncbi:hypothetical protein [Rugosimonospora africana]|uniref:hypothetical protein n=1 Tax=Rugosimonospora africana TaxID=556532 RepID=UPI001941E5D9|nr:hypothetical protein [Rugosimonospora africana]
MAPTEGSRDGATEAGEAPTFWRRYHLGVWLLVILVAALVASAFLPWEWSFIDDGNQITILRGDQAAHGWLGGILQDMIDMYHKDRWWGLFRPSFWVFAGTFYLLPVGPAHAVRLAMVVCAIGGPLVVAARRFTGRPRAAMLVWTLAAVVASQQFFAGIWYPSLQETSGLCFVGLGLIAQRRPVVRALCWLVAAWFKAPFSWLLLAYGLVLCRRRETRLVGAVTSLVAVATLAITAYMSHVGFYTGAMNLSRHTVRVNFDTSVGQLAVPLLVVVAGLAVMRPRIDVSGDPTALVMLLGGAGYLANLLVWKVDAYYAGPYTYLLTLAVVFAVSEVGTRSLTRLAAALAVSAVLGGYFLFDNAQYAYNRLSAVNALRDCVLRLPGSPVVGFNREEASVRLDFIVREHRPHWGGEVTWVRPDQLTGADGKPLRYFINQPGYEASDRSLTSGPVVCHTSEVSIYRVVSQS